MTQSTRKILTENILRQKYKNGCFFLIEQVRKLYLACFTGISWTFIFVNYFLTKKINFVI